MIGKSAVYDELLSPAIECGLEISYDGMTVEI